METPTIYMNINGFLANALSKSGIKPEDYRPAYEGESIAIDLYHASDSDLLIPPMAQAQGGVDEVAPYTRRLMPTGLRVALPPGWGAFVFERGSITKTTLKQRAGVIDPGYSGEIFVNCVNLHPSEIAVIESLAKSPFQLVFLPCNTNLQQVSSEEFERLHSNSLRGDGKIGSSN